MATPDPRSAAQVMDDMVTKRVPLPAYLARTAGPLSRDDALQVQALTEQANELEGLLQDQSYWAGYVRRNGRFAATDHRVNLADKVQQLDVQLYPLLNPGAPSIAEQGHAYLAAKAAAKRTSTPGVIASLLYLALGLGACMTIPAITIVAFDAAASFAHRSLQCMVRTCPPQR